jgi:cytochrome P450
MLAVTDGERHRSLRGLMRGALTVPLMKAAGEQAAQQLDRIVARLCDGQVFDVATEVAEKVPIGVTCSLLGIPTNDVPWLLSRSKRALSSETESTDWIEAIEARNEILIYLGDLARSRRANPGEDVVSSMAAATIDGRQLSLDDVALNCYSLILGGDESSRVSAICAVETFAQRPDVWEQVRTGAVGIDSAVEEILRWATPALHFARTATSPFTLRGQDIAEGDVVALWNISANFDETQFESPREFRPTRSPNRHVSLGFGPHFCIGAWLGRAELKALLAALTTHVASMEIVRDSHPVHSTFLRGTASLPMRFIGSQGTGSST